MTTTASHPAISALDHLQPSAPHAFNPSTDIPSLAGKIFLITGANSGIGKQTAVELARHGPAQIWITARQVESGQEAVRDIKIAGSSVDIRLLKLDLTSFESIKAAARIVLVEATKLDMLMLNAGIVSD